MKYQLQHELKNLNYLIDHILYQIFKIILNKALKKHETVTDNPSIMIYINKIENGIMFRIKTGYYLKLLGRTKSKITKNENGKNVPHLEITKVVLLHCNIVKNDYQQNSRVLCTFIRIKSFG